MLVLEQLNDKIVTFERRYGRTPGSILLVGVSKGQSLQAIEVLYEAGQKNFAENYVQEALPKIEQAKHQGLQIVWHFIGKPQTNKLKAIANHFDWVQTLDSITHAKLLNQHRPKEFPPLNCCIQISVKEGKSLMKEELQDLESFAVAITQFERLSLRGMMCMIPATSEFDQQKRYFDVCREAYEHLKQTLPFLDTLSMGMSADFEAAIASGATLLRIGTALFGPRQIKSFKVDR